MVDVALAAPAAGRIGGDHDVRLRPPDPARDLATKVEGWLQGAVVIAEKEDVLHPELHRRRALLRMPNLGQPLSGHGGIAAATVAVGQDQIGHLAPFLRPLRHRSGGTHFVVDENGLAEFLLHGACEYPPRDVGARPWPKRDNQGDGLGGERLSLRRGGAKRGREQGKQSQGREQDAAIGNRKTNDRLHVASLPLPSGRTGTRRARHRSFNARRLLTCCRAGRLDFCLHSI